VAFPNHAKNNRGVLPLLALYRAIRIAVGILYLKSLEKSGRTQSEKPDRRRTPRGGCSVSIFQEIEMLASLNRSQWKFEARGGIQRRGMNPLLA
jgi:hypothetical protein